MSKIFVEFVPDVDKGVDGPASTGVTDEDGRFRLRLMLPGGKSKMGAVIGWHRVVLTDVGRPVTPPIPPPRVAPRFSNYESTPLTKEVVKDGGLYKIELTGDTTTDQQAKQ